MTIGASGAISIGSGGAGANTINTEIINLKGWYETYSSSFKKTFSITKKRDIYKPAITATVTRTFISCMILLNKLLL